LRYKKITLENFRTFQDKNEFVFPKKGKVSIIHAINGTGKSAMLHAMNFVLYGKAPNPKSLDGNNFTYRELMSIPKYNEKKYFFSVNLEFEHEGIDYEIDRRIQVKSDVSVLPDSDNFYEEKLIVKKGDNILSAQASQPEIENLMSREVSRFFVVNREEINDLDTSLQDEREAEKIKRQIEKSIGVEVLERGTDLLSSLANEFVKESSKDTDNSKKAQKAKESFEAEYERNENHKKNISEYKKRLKEYGEKIHELTKKQNKMKSIEEEANKKNELTNRFYDLEKEKNEKLGEIRDYLKNNWYLPISDIAINVYEDASANVESAHKLQTKINELKTNINIYKNEIKEKKCKSCGQSTNQKIIDKRKKQLDAAEKKLTGLEETYQNPDEIFPSAQNIKPYLEASIEVLQEKEKAYNKIQLEIFTIENEIKKINQGFNDSLVQEVKKVSNELSKIIEQETLMKNELKDEEDSLVFSSNKLKKEQKEIDKYSTDTKASTKKSQFSRGVRDLFEEAFISFRDNARGDVGKLAEAVFSNLINNKGYQIRLEDDYSISMLDDTGEKAGAPSEGQSGIIAISLIAALARHSVTNAPIIMDSPMAGLDEDHTKKVWKFIHEFADQVILFVYPGEYIDKDHRKIIEKNLSVEYTLHTKGVMNAKISDGYKPNLLVGGK